MPSLSWTQEWLSAYRLHHFLPISQFPMNTQVTTNKWLKLWTAIDFSVYIVGKLELLGLGTQLYRWILYKVMVHHKWNLCIYQLLLKFTQLHSPKPSPFLLRSPYSTTKAITKYSKENTTVFNVFVFMCFFTDNLLYYNPHIPVKIKFINKKILANLPINQQSWMLLKLTINGNPFIEILSLWQHNSLSQIAAS